MSDGVFRTQQTVERYEQALSRHGQWLRWTQGIRCPCVNTENMQPEANCRLCSGRGQIYRTPDKFQIFDEVTVNVSGVIKPKQTPVIADSIAVYYKGTLLELGEQPADGSYIQLAPPYPERFRELFISYEFTPKVPVVGENSEVYDATHKILRVIAGRFAERMKTFEGSIQSVSRVYNATTQESLQVQSATKEFITLESLGSWEEGNVLEVDYVYVNPFNFLLTLVEGHVKYGKTYVLEDADASLTTPYWARPDPDDLFTALSQEQVGTVILDPAVTDGNDVISSQFDIARISRVIDIRGREYITGPGKDVEVFGRNELKWNIEKPQGRYTAQFTYHPTYVSLTNLHSLRSSENKNFVNKIGLKQFDRLHEEVQF